MIGLEYKGFFNPKGKLEENALSLSKSYIYIHLYIYMYVYILGGKGKYKTYKDYLKSIWSCIIQRFLLVGQVSPYN